MYSKEEEKKFTSEYVQNFSLGQEQIKKKKNFNKALEIFKQCLDLAKKINNNQKLCESYYYNGLCYFTLYNLIESETNFNSSFSLINSFDQSNFPYYKIRGKIFAYIVHTNFLLKSVDENINFINDNINSIIKFKLEEKLVIFYNFIKEILYPLKKGNRFNEFKNEYYSSKNNILYNNENTISIKLKSIFLNLMNYNSMKLIFQKDILLYYINTYNIPSNHLIFNCFEKSDEFINEKSKYKITFESLIKTNKIKIDKEFNTTSSKLIQERKDLFDKFKKIWELLSLSFQHIFKNHLNITFSSSSKTNQRKRVVTPNLISNLKEKNSSDNKQPKSTKNNRRSSHITTSTFNENEKVNFKKDIFIEPFKTERNDGKNEIDYSRVINSTSIISNSIFLRNANPFLIKTLISEFGKVKEIRKCDIINLKIPNYVSSYSKLSRKGNHGLSLIENVNQDTVFLYKNFLLIKDLYFFGVCDGHGPSGHKISQIFTTLFQSFFLYNEMDNYLSKKNKSINNYLSSLLSSTDENKNVKEMDIIKYFYTKLQINCNELSLIKNNFTELSTNIKESILNSQNELIKYSKDFDIQNSGSTICSLILKSNTLTCINIGDSRAILISKNKNGTWNYSQLTKDHKPTEKEEKNRIESNGGLIHKIINYDDDDNKEIGPYRVWFKDDSKGPGLSMSRSFGDFLSKEIGVCCEPDIFRYELKEDDKFIVVASDGVWEFMSNENVMNTIVNCSNSDEACEVIVKEAVMKWKEYSKKNVDDISCVVVEVCVKK